MLRKLDFIVRVGQSHQTNHHGKFLVLEHYFGCSVENTLEEEKTGWREQNMNAESKWELIVDSTGYYSGVGRDCMVLWAI